MRSALYIVEAEATKEQARRLHMNQDISKWEPDDFYDCQEAISHNIEQIARREFDTYEEVAKFFESLRSTRYQDGSRWVATLKVLEKLDDDGEFLDIEFAPFEEDENE